MQLCGTFERIATGESHKFYTEIRTCMRSRARYQSHTWKECCTLRASKFSNRALVLLSVTVLFIPMQKYENKSGHRCRNVRNITMDTPARYNCVSPVTELQLNVNSSSNSFSNTVSDKNSWDTSIAPVLLYVWQFPRPPNVVHRSQLMKSCTPTLVELEDS